MKSASLIILASLVICKSTLSEEQGISAEDGTDRRTTIDDIILHKAESLLLRSIIKKLQEEDDRYDGVFPQPEWVTKRQHPGKRYINDLEKRQHPGRREEDEDDLDLDVQKRQHPGKREEEMHASMGFQKRQHPGKRSMAGHVSESPIILFSELSKRQHPGKRYLMLHSKRQHPGKRLTEEEDGEEDWGMDEEDELPELEKRQHPGKRFWENSNPELGTNSPCDLFDSESCRKTSLLLDFLDNITKSHDEEKRQHPGKRSAAEEDLVEGE
ncbi:pro-thyrotropin-releasing hormone [Menidia menidia]